MAEKVFIAQIGPVDRIAVRFETSPPRVVESYSLQYECIFDDGGRWEVVRRYDSSHSVAHVHVMHPNGEEDRMEYQGLTLNEGMALAHVELKTNWQRFRREYAAARYKLGRQPS